MSSEMNGEKRAPRTAAMARWTIVVVGRSFLQGEICSRPIFWGCRRQEAERRGKTSLGRMWLAGLGRVRSQWTVAGGSQLERVEERDGLPKALIFFTQSLAADSEYFALIQALILQCVPCQDAHDRSSSRHGCGWNIGPLPRLKRGWWTSEVVAGLDPTAPSDCNTSKFLQLGVAADAFVHRVCMCTSPVYILYDQCRNCRSRPTRGL